MNNIEQHDCTKAKTSGFNLSWLLFSISMIGLTLVILNFFADSIVLFAAGLFLFFGPPAVALIIGLLFS